MKNIVILLNILFITSAFCMTDESLPEIMQKDRTLRPYVRDLITNSSCEKKKEVLETIESPESFLTLNYNDLMRDVFGTHGWWPHAYTFENTALQELFNPYSPQRHSSDWYMIFLANVLYEAGGRLYEQSKDPTHLEHAASLGHANAQFKMFSIDYKLGKREEAKNYLLCSAAQGNDDALLKLSEVYEGHWRLDISKNLMAAKLLCQEAANLGNSEAEFNIKVTTLVEGTFDSQTKYQQGIINARELAERDNKHAQKFIDAIMRSSGEALQEGNDIITYDDLNFLKSFLGWKDEGEE